MKPEPTNIDLVDALYDELPESERADLLAHIEADEEESRALRSYRAVLDLVRAHDEEILPTSEAREALIAQAQRAQTPWWVRLLGPNLVSLITRPAFGAALLVVLLVGVGLFVSLRSREDAPGGPSGQAVRKGGETRSLTAARDETTLAEAAGAARGTTNGLVADEGLGEEQNRAAALAKAESSGREVERDTLHGAYGHLASSPGGAVDSLAGSDKESARKGKFAATILAGTGRGGGGKRAPIDSQRDFASTENPMRGVTRRRRNPVAGPRLDDDGASRPSPRARPVGSASPAPTVGLVRAARVGTGKGQEYQTRTASGRKGQTAQRARGANATQRARGANATQRAPALYRSAQAALVRGKVAQACSLFAALVRHHRSYPLRADALLAWARCEMARGAYGQARRVIAQLMREYPSWRKSGHAVLAQMQRRQRQSRAHRKRRAAKRAPARRSRRPSSQQTSN